MGNEVKAEGGAAEPKVALTEHAVKVLLVDDQPIIGEAVRRMLAGHPDISFHYCNDPLQAVERAHTEKPTVILSDLVMPQLDGLELVKRFRADKITQGIPLIVLSTKEEPATKAEAFSNGANDYLVKLPDPVELLARIRHHSQGYINLLQRDEAFRELSKSRQAMADDLDEAARYVQSLLPAPTSDRVVVDWRFVPSASLGGDAFGYHWLDDDHFGVYLLDVSGHGVGSALLGVSVMNALRGRSLPDTDFRDPGQVLTRLNTTFRTQEHGGKFFTIWYGVYRLSTRTLAWAGAGHPAAILFRSPDVAGGAELLPSGGPMPGVLEVLTYHTKTCEVSVGARLFVYSDGVYELRGHDDRVRTHDEFLETLDTPTIRTLDAIIETATSVRAAEEFDDDVSLLLVDFP
ncbi:MAG: fused response regulator/phosphatase [Planctomycetota bacterium]|nr:fused response regulator/phosphatase [Planctomycetota bacterium]